MSGTNTPHSRGHHFGFWFFATLIRLTGLRGAYAFLYPVCLWYLLFDRQAVAAARPYLRHRFPDHGWLRLRLDCLRLFLAQGRHLIDRHLFVHRPEAFAVRLDAPPAFHELLAGKQGFIMVTAHVGNWQMAMHACRRFQRRVNLLMLPEANPAVHAALRPDSQDATLRIISPAGFMGGTLEMLQALQQGEIVAIMGDRSYQSATTPVPFLGGTARLPYSAFKLAAAARCPVAVLFSAKTAAAEYSVSVPILLSPPAEEMPAREKDACCRQQAAQFAASLEHFAHQHPYQCFLFEDVWKCRCAGAHITSVGVPHCRC